MEKNKMGSVNICLKRSYIGVTSLIAAFMILLLGFTIWAHSYIVNTEETEVNPGLNFIYGFSAITLILVIIGGFGAWKEKKWAFMVFAAGMILICLYLLGTEISVQVLKPQVENTLKLYYITMLPLANATKEELTFLKYIQSDYQCCGMESYRDWENNIPESCLCAEKSTNPCMAAPRDTNLFMEGWTVRIYAEPCLPLVVAQTLLDINVTTAVRVGFMLLWVLSIGLCAAILCQMSKKLETPQVVYSSEAKSGNYSCLIEAPDPHDN